MPVFSKSARAEGRGRQRADGRDRSDVFARTWLAMVIALAIGCGASGCGGSEAATTPPPATAPEPAVPEATAPPVVAAEAPAADEACASVIVVAWQGADHAAETITRTETEARERAEQLLQRVEASEDFAAIARAESDAASSGPRGGLLGTYARADWPAAHEPIREPIWALGVGQTSEVLRAPYGWVIARRCAVEHVHTRHILVRFAGARNAGPEITRTRDEAHEVAERIWNELQAPGADFAAIARERSEDTSAERGGDVGVTGRGRLAEAYEREAYALQPNAIAPIVETDFGFHIIQRLPD